MNLNPADIKCVVFDMGFTLCRDYYFKLAPPGYPNWREVIQEHVFRNPSIVNPWMRGELSLTDVAELVSVHIAMDVPSIVSTMEKGCMDLEFNPAVWNFARVQKSQGRKTALVTDNMDVFTQVVVPAHRLDQVFDVIVNSSDYHVIDKEFLWRVAFEQIGNGTGYANSLLIEDGENEPAKFRALGGQAYQYSNDAAFLEWLDFVHWSDLL